MNAGRKVSLLRKIKDVSQKDLAKGIISVSHLSNLERGRYNASDETLTLLAKRLGVPDTYIDDYPETDPEFEGIVSSLLEKLILDVDEFEKAFDSISPSFTDFNHDIAYHFLKCGFLYKKMRLQEAAQLEHDYIKHVLSEIDFNNMPDYLNKTYLYYQGRSYLHKNNWRASCFSYRKLIDFSLSKQAKAYLNNSLAILSYEQLDFFSASKYGELAITQFEHDEDWEKVARLHYFLGIIYIDLEMYQEALSRLGKTLDVAKQMDLTELEGITSFYKGVIFRCQGLHEQANVEYKKAYRMLKGHTDLVFILFEWIGSELFLGNKGEAKHLLEKAQDLLSDDRRFYLQLSLQADYDLLEDDNVNYLNKKEQSLAFFLEHNYLSHAQGISEALGDYHQRNHKYKNAAYYFKEELRLKDKIGKTH